MDDKSGQHAEQPRGKNEENLEDRRATQDEDDEALVDKSNWMIRPCAVYDAEHWDCLKPKGRFYQYYIDGELADCNKWVQLEKDCRKWMNDDNIAAAARIIRHEKAVVERRVQSRLQNDIWVRRDDKERPPQNWNDPLPPHISEKHEGSYLAENQDDLLLPLGVKKNWCSIS